MERGVKCGWCPPPADGKKGTFPRGYGFRPKSERRRAAGGLQPLPGNGHLLSVLSMMRKAGKAGMGRERHGGHGGQGVHGVRGANA
jgi:hypothetical protein